MTRGATVTVVGAGGVVGRRVVRMLGTAEIDVRRVDTRTSMLSVGPGDVVVLASPAPHAPIAAEIGAAGASVVSVVDHLDDTRELLELDDAFLANDAALVVGAGMAPGLSGLVARHLADQLDEVDEIHVAVHATAGPACARQHHWALRGTAMGWHDGDWIERPAGSGRELCWFPEPVGARDCYRAEMPSPLVLHRSFPDVRRISSRLSATRRDRLTARLPMLRRPHPEGGVGALRVEVRGAHAGGARVTLVAGVAELVGSATGATVAAMAAAASRGELPTGVVLAGDAGLDTRALLSAIGEHGVRLQEFTGVPQRG